MKKNAVRRIAVLLCVLSLLALFPVGSRADSAYTTVTKSPEKEEYVSLQLPNKNNLFTAKNKLPKRAEVKASWKNGSIYFMPRPAEANGVLGTVDTGTPVTILAQQNGLYFFMTDDGRMGWNGKGFFTKPKALDKDLTAPLGEDSPLTGQDAVTVSEFLRDSRRAGAASTYFYADRPVVVIKNGETARITVRGLNSKAPYKFERTSGSSAEGEWLGEKFVNYQRGVEFTAKEPGASVFKFTNTNNRQSFNVLVIVV